MHHQRMRTTVTVSDDDLVAHVDARDAPTDAGRVRECIRRSQELDECRERVADLEQQVERLEREKRLILEQREEHARTGARPGWAGDAGSVVVVRARRGRVSVYACHIPP